MLASKDLFEEIKKLTKNPKFICFNCGRVADFEQERVQPHAPWIDGLLPTAPALTPDQKYLSGESMRVN